MEPIIAKHANQKPNDFTKDTPAVVPLKSILIFLGATLCSALILEVLVPPLDDGGIWNLLRLYNEPELTSTGQSKNTSIDSLPKFAIYGKSKTEEHLIHVLAVLERFGYQRTTIENDWDLLWAHDYPFLQMPERLKNLQPHQKVNHFPGCGFITNKVDLSTTPLPFLPKAFKLPSQKDAFLHYTRENPTALFVQKHNEHRHIEIKSPSEINLNATSNFVQEFIPNPFLVDGYKFDIGVYVLVTSIDPLRVYIYTGDVLFRYCPVKYHPFDPNNIDKYVVGDDYLPTWQVPSLVKYYKKFSANMRDAFDAYVRDQSKDPSGIWIQVEEIIRRTILAKEKNIADILRSYKTRNFFELMRFDLIIDEDLRVILMEANMSPNLSSAHFKPNSLLYEQILYSTLKLVGVGSPVRRTSLNERPSEVEKMICTERNLVTNVNLCADFDCDKTCYMDECQLCLTCLDENSYEMLKNAYREHLHKTNMKRIFPTPILNPKTFNIKTEVKNLSQKNQLMSRWFHGKCMNDRNWCY